MVKNHAENELPEYATVTELARWTDTSRGKIYKHIRGAGISPKRGKKFLTVEVLRIIAERRSLDKNFLTNPAFNGGEGENLKEDQGPSPLELLNQDQERNEKIHLLRSIMEEAVTNFVFYLHHTHVFKNFQEEMEKTLHALAEDYLTGGNMDLIWEGIHGRKIDEVERIQCKGKPAERGFYFTEQKSKKKLKKK